MVVQHNLTAMNANRYLGINNSKLSKSLEKLSSGYAINRAGDNAAGLAVSEKMRSQIAGMTQGVKNAQDGISMVQTFEGALTETDSILQRMKTLADQMANGSYDDPVDRTAAQQEFLQLNDELDQIADTDFNGVTVLNGGIMSDGTKAAGVTEELNAAGVTVRKFDKDAENAGLIDYKAAKDAAKAAEAAKADAAAADAELLKTAEDFCGDTDAGTGKIVDNSTYDKDAADAIWDKLGIETKSTDKANPDELQITFTYDGSAWKATGVADKAGKAVEVEADKLAALTTTKTANGGFSIDGTDLNLVFNTKDVQKYDTATVKVQNLKAETYAPTNIDILEDSFTKTSTPAATDADATDVAGKITITLSDDAKDATKMDADMEKALGALRGTTFQTVLNNGVAGAATAATAGTFTDSQNQTRTIAIDNTSGEISWSDGAGIKHVLGTLKVDNTTLGAGKTGTFQFKVELDAYKYGDAKGLKANTVATPTASKPNADMFNAAGAADADDEFKVSTSDALKNSEIKMTYKDSITLQVGARTKDAVNFTFKYNSEAIGDLEADLDCSSKGLGTNLLNLSTQDAANEAIDKIDQAINKVSLVRGTFGAIQNRLEHKIDNLNVSVENLTSAESQIRDTNMPQEMMNFTKQQILAQASQSMLAQANQLPQSVLSLLQ